MTFLGKPETEKPEHVLRKFDLLANDGDSWVVEADYISIGGQHISFWIVAEPRDRLTYAVRADIIETIEEQ